MSVAVAVVSKNHVQETVFLLLLFPIVSFLVFWKVPSFHSSDDGLEFSRELRHRSKVPCFLIGDVASA